MKAKMSMDTFSPAELCEDLVCCVICFEPYSDTRIPKALPCLHTFCSDCLRGSIEAHLKIPRKDRSAGTPRFFPCPVCKEDIRIPENGMKGFKDDFRIRRISEVVSKMKSPSFEHKVIPLIDQKCDVCKFFKKDIPGPLYCVECSKFLCKSCSEKHLMMTIAKNHNIVDAKHMGNQENEVSCPEHEGEVLRYFCRDCNRSLCATCTFTDEHTNHKVVELTDEGLMVKSKLSELLANCHQKIPELKTVIKDFEALEQKLAGRETVAQKAILLWTIQEMNRIRKEQQAMEKELQTLIQKKNQEIHVGHQKTQAHLNEMTSYVELMDKMVTSGQNVQLVSSFTETTGRLRTFAAFKTPQPPEESEFSDLGRFDNLIEQFEDDLQKELKESGDNIMQEMKSIANKMSVLTANKSEIDVQLVTRFGKKGSGNGQFQFPSGVAISPATGDIVIADQHNSRIQVFDRDGKFLRKFVQEHFKPCGIVVRQNGDIVVSDTHNHANCIRIFSPTGTRKQVVGQGDFDYPFCIALDSREQFVVSDSAKNEIVIMNDRGQLKNRFPTRTKFAFYLAVNTKDQILSSDWYHHCIRVFDLEGSMLRRIGTSGFDDGQMMIPLGICTDSNDFVYILDCKCHRVAVFTSDNMFIKNILQDKSDGMDYSRAVALAKDGRLVVTYGDNKRDVPNEVGIYQLTIHT